MPDEYVKRSDVHKAFQPKYAPAINKTFAAMIDSVPAADVVEVVRCRDCKFYDCEDGDQKCVKDAEWVEDDACYYGFISYQGPEFYCADGKRKDGGQDDGI